MYKRRAGRLQKIPRIHGFLPELIIYLNSPYDHKQ